MTKRRRYLLTGLFLAVAALLVLGAHRHQPGEDPDNQGGVALALIALLGLLVFAIIKTSRAVSTAFRSRR